MTTTDTGIAQHLFDADCGLHFAKQSGVAVWIEAAHEHLIAADLEYRAALDAAAAAAAVRAP